MTWLVKATTAFKREYKLMQKRGADMRLLQDVVTKLANGETLPEANCDHPLTGNYIGFRECHIRPNWLLIYKYYEEQLILSLVHTGTHSDFFG